MCRERHPKPCKFYIRNGQCTRKEECAYGHKKSDDNIKIELLEIEVKKLKSEIKQLTSNMSEIMIKMITLEECEKPFNSVHLKSVPKECDLKKGPFKCDKCNLGSETNHAQTKHVEEGHEVADFFQCKMCKSCFDTKIQLMKHTNTKHLSTDIDDYRFNCKVCHKTFWNSLDLVKHLNEHVAEENIKYTDCHDEPFRCKICGTFTSLIDDEIRKHVIKHVEDTLNPKEDYSKDMTELLPTIEEELEDSQTEESDTSLNDSELYAGFDEDGNRIIDGS